MPDQAGWPNWILSNSTPWTTTRSSLPRQSRLKEVFSNASIAPDDPERNRRCPIDLRIWHNEPRTIKIIKTLDHRTTKSWRLSRRSRAPTMWPDSRRDSVGVRRPCPNTGPRATLCSGRVRNAYWRTSSTSTITWPTRRGWRRYSHRNNLMVMPNQPSLKQSPVWEEHAAIHSSITRGSEQATR